MKKRRTQKPHFASPQTPFTIKYPLVHPIRLSLQSKILFLISDFFYSKKIPFSIIKIKYNKYETIFNEETQCSWNYHN